MVERLQGARSPSDPPHAPPAQRSLKARALQWLAQREHSRAELRRKLLAYSARGEQPMSADARTVALPAPAAESAAESMPALVDALLDWLESHRYLSAERFVEARVHARSGRFGNLRIRQELRQHRLALSPDAARALEATELQRAQAVHARKFPRPAHSPAERARQARFLAGRGFSPEVIGQAMREAARSLEASADREAGLVREADDDRDANAAHGADDPRDGDVA